ncbi:MAG TPA: amidohydrolase family protein [Candidatus Binatia bacterium]|nr:amidohydrolase family protein [Candidatus Binatia bacterium]
MGGIIDADTHIAESENMWKLIDPSMYHRRPIMVSAPPNTLYRDFNVLWLIDGDIFPKAAGKGGFRLITPAASLRETGRTDIHRASREISEVAGRLSDMDNAGVAVQVIYPTLFLVQVTDDPILEAALSAAYNKYLAQVYHQGNGRLRWVAVLPLHSVDESIRQMHEAKQNGAVGLFFTGIVGSLTLNNPHFYPIYAEAEKLNLPICIHTGQSSRRLRELFDLELNGTFAASHLPPVIGFRDLVASEIPEKFPGLKFGFLEASASWVPYLYHHLKRSARPRPSFPNARWKHASCKDLFRDYRIYIACEADEDIAYLAGFIGEDHIMIGSDYGHNDPAEEKALVQTMRSREDLSAELVDKILSENPKRFYSLQ